MDFDISAQSIKKNFYTKNEKFHEWIEKLQGVKGLAKLLKTDLEKGICGNDKKQIFFRRKAFESLMDSSQNKTPLKKYYAYQSRYQILLCFLLFLFHLLKSNNDVYNFGQTAEFFFEGLGFLFSALVLLIFSFTKLNEFPMKNIQTHGKNYKVIREGEISSINYDDLLIGDILIINSPCNIGLIAGILIEGQIEIMSKNFEKSHPISKNERVFEKTQIINGEGKIMICKLGGEEIDNDEILYQGCDKLIKLLYK